MTPQYPREWTADYWGSNPPSPAYIPAPRTLATRFRRVVAWLRVVTWGDA